MLTIYVGKLPEFICEYNGKRYVFSRRNPIKDVPPEVYDSVMTSGHVNAKDVRIYEQGYVEEIERLKARIVELEKKPEKKEAKGGSKAKKDKKLPSN